MKLTINHISVENFRCFDNLETDLWDKTIVKGDNEAGKSTIATAILWCLTGKDVAGNSNFEIVPAGKYGEVSPSVELECTVDEKPLTLKRVYKAKFTRDKRFSDYVTTCYVNGLETGARKFQDYISQNICDEKVFKILSNPSTFVENCPKEQKELVWQAQRRMLMEMVEGQSDLEIAQSSPEWERLIEPLKRYASINQYLSFVKQEMSKVEKEINSFGSKMEQQEKNIQPVEMTLNEATKQKEALTAELDSLEEQERKSQSDEMSKKLDEIRKEISETTFRKNEVISEYQSQLNDLESKKQEIESEAGRSKADADVFIARQSRYAQAVEELKKTKISKYCPTCKQPLTQQMIQQQVNEVKQRIRNGEEYVEKARVSAEACMKRYNEQMAMAQSLIEPVYPAKEIDALQERIEALEKEIDSVANSLRSNANSSFEEKKAEIEKEIDKIRYVMYTIEQNTTCEQRMKELEEENEKAVRLLNKLQIALDLCKDFISEKCKGSEESINSLFKTVKFQLFQEYKSNDDIREVCNMTFNGHQYEDLSASTKLVANLELMTAFQKHYDAYVPVILDNMESVTADIPEAMQTIKMYVVEERCHECGGKSGRRDVDGKWTCLHCSNRWTKELEITEE